MMKFAAKVNIPTLNINEGQLFKIPDDEFQSDLGNKIFKNTDYFKRIFDPDEVIHVGDRVVVSGYWRSHENKWKNRPVKLKPTITRIHNITECPCPVNGYLVVAIDDGGNTYEINTVTIEKTAFTTGVCCFAPGLPTYIKYDGMYWFVNSEGKLCCDMKGHKPKRDVWLRASGNYFKTRQEAEAYKNKIMKQ